jgi:hypothetical protein
MRVDYILSNDEGLLCPHNWVDNFSLFLDISLELSDETLGNFSQFASVLFVHGSEKVEAVILEQESS